MRCPATTLGRRRQRGVGLVETLVGVTIGLLVVLVIYNLLAVGEGYKRMTTGYADAQITGLISHFVTGQDAANGGNGLSSAYDDLIGCHNDEGGVHFVLREDASLKPIPVMITRSLAADKSDSFISRGSASIHVVWPVPMRPLGGVGDVPPGGQIEVQSPTGFMTPGKVSLPDAVNNPHWAVAIKNNKAEGKCGLIQITNAAPSPDMDKSGDVILTQGVPATTITYTGEAQNDAGNGARLLSLGRVGDTTRIRYEAINDTSVPPNERFRLVATNCMTPTGCTGQTRNPIAQNVVLMKVQYGIDTSAALPNRTLDATVDCWTSDTETCPVALPAALPFPINIPDWDPSTLVKAGDNLNFPDPADGSGATPLIPANALNRIVAVRIGIVVRSDEPDMRDPALFVAPATTIDGKTGTRPVTNAANGTYLFNCAANTNAGCPSRVAVSTGAGAVMQDGYRYRTYEAVIPLRNSIFAATLPP